MSMNWEPEEGVKRYLEMMSFLDDCLREPETYQ